MKQSLLKAKMKWRRYSVEFVLLFAVSIAITIKVKDGVRDELMFDKKPKLNYSQYYDYVEPNIP